MWQGEERLKKKMDEHEAVERKSEAETTRRNAAKSDWPVLVSTAVKKKEKKKNR